MLMSPEQYVPDMMSASELSDLKIQYVMSTIHPELVFDFRGIVEISNHMQQLKDQLEYNYVDTEALLRSSLQSTQLRTSLSNEV